MQAADLPFLVQAAAGQNTLVEAEGLAQGQLWMNYSLFHQSPASHPVSAQADVALSFPQIADALIDPLLQLLAISLMSIVPILSVWHGLIFLLIAVYLMIGFSRVWMILM